MVGGIGRRRLRVGSDSHREEQQDRPGDLMTNAHGYEQIGPRYPPSASAAPASSGVSNRPPPVATASRVQASPPTARPSASTAAGSRSRLLLRLDMIAEANSPLVADLRQRLRSIPYIQLVEDASFDLLLRGSVSVGANDVRLLTPVGDATKLGNARSIPRGSRPCRSTPRIRLRPQNTRRPAA